MYWGLEKLRIEVRRRYLFEVGEVGIEKKSTAGGEEGLIRKKLS